MDERARSTQRAYDHVAEDFAARTTNRSAMATEFFDEFERSLAPGSVVADLGCGPGHDLGRFLLAGHVPRGIDRSQELLRQRPPGTSAVAGDLRAIPLAANSVDGIWSSAALLHIDRVDLDPTLQEWDRVLRPGGVVGIATSLSKPDAADEGWEVVPAGPGRVPEIAAGDSRWFVHHSANDIVGAIENAGWSVMSSAVRESHRQWLQIQASKPGSTR